MQLTFKTLVCTALLGAMAVSCSGENPTVGSSFEKVRIVVTDYDEDGILAKFATNKKKLYDAEFAKSCVNCAAVRKIINPYRPDGLKICSYSVVASGMVLPARNKLDGLIRVEKLYGQLKVEDCIDHKVQ